MDLNSSKIFQQFSLKPKLHIWRFMNENSFSQLVVSFISNACQSVKMSWREAFTKKMKTMLKVTLKVLQNSLIIENGEFEW